MALRSLLTRPSVLKQALSKSSVRMVPSMQFHAGMPRREEEKSTGAVVAKEDQGGMLSDWNIMGPIALALAIPALQNGVYVLNEESQLACCFMLFCTSVYKFGGEAIGSYFDERSNALLKEHNMIEDRNIEVTKKMLQTHMQHLEVVDDMTSVYDAHQAVVRKMCEVENHKLRHEVRDIFEKNLEAIVSYEAAYQAKMQKDMVEYATKKVYEAIQQGGKALKEGTLKQAFADLATINVEETEEAEDDGKQDEIVTLFIKYLHEYGDFLEKKTGQKVKLTPEQIADFQSELDIFMKRVNLEELELKAPSELTFGLIK